MAAAQVTSSYFQTLGVRLVAGRAFTAEEERPGSGAAVAVINYETWQDLGGTPSVLGRTITVNAHPFTVVGVAPAGFAGTLVAFGPRLWVPLGADPLVTEDAPASPGAADPATRRRNLGLVGACARMSPSTARTPLLAGVSDGLVDRTAAGTAGVVTVHRPARTEDGDAPGDDSGLFAPLGTLAGMAAVLLLVASLNVANMQLARGTTRRKENRHAPGAGRRPWTDRAATAGGRAAPLAGGRRRRAGRRHVDAAAHRGVAHAAHRRIPDRVARSGRAGRHGHRRLLRAGRAAVRPRAVAEAVATQCVLGPQKHVP